ncbi:dynein axonemal heavy chain 1-like [Chrysoperla carnea]|uniref:dynein axonemal heavy chain 1-like n=1 Tax=Chrysoperla carnea TaxID=189513 RepID=UPI001D07F9C5|nr:dynein axonemal heavy chain 1-like [Chrysoperla carnea]
MSQLYNTLRDALTAIKGKPSPTGMPFEAVYTYVLNPKSITMGQLYGEFDIYTHEWTDGILPSIVRIGAAATNNDQHWYILDGPVDAVWIENMNTVLDDNKKLCLTSGEIIKLTNNQKMVFEVADLAVASPATVSRCGMVYIEPAVLGLQPYLNCWSKRTPPLFEEYKNTMLSLVTSYLLPAVEFLRTQLKEIVTSVDSAVVTSCLNLLDLRLRPLTSKDGVPPPDAQAREHMKNLMVPWILFSIIWSVGATCDMNSRKKFSEWMRNKQKANIKHPDIVHGPLFPAAGLVYDYRLHDGGFNDRTAEGDLRPPQWINWLADIPDIEITAETKFADIEVPTLDNVRNAELLEMILWNEKNVLCVGPTGTGKTQTIVSKLSKSINKKFVCDFIIFSARTNARQIQNLLDSKVEKRKRGVYGPPPTKRQVFFIDDLNMPALEVYGAQPPIELIRQWMDFGGWYDSKEVGVFREIIESNFVAAMGPPGGGRNPVTARLLRHFHYIAFTEMQPASVFKIFSTILQFWLGRTASQLHSYLAKIVEASMNVYDTVLQVLLPTPAKTHYTFNLRDISKVFQGMLMRNPETLTDPYELFRLWYHENCRVYQDRMINDEDRNWFSDQLKSRIQSYFSANPSEALGDDLIIFGEFMDFGAEVRRYLQVNDWDKVNVVLLDYLKEYNNQTTKPMKLVLFFDAIAHISRISRIIRPPLGNALLLGMGGSGRQSLTRLAAFMSEYICFQIELSKAYSANDWRDDLKKCMLGAGLMNKTTVFLFSDTQIKSESFLEDLNNILNSGDVPNIYKPEEYDKIFNGMKQACVEMDMVPTKTNLFSIYQKSVKSNLHTVITMSPIGEIFRQRLRQFPALVNCCTIDWFSAWPDTALQSVALQFLKEIPDLNVSKEVLDGIVVVVQYMHQTVVTASDLFLQELNRHNYVTPTSYLELLNAYIILMSKKKGELTKAALRLKTGMAKLDSTGEEVKEMQINLGIMKPQLEIAVKDAAVMIELIAKDTAVAEETKLVVEKEEAIAMEMAAKTQEIADSAQRDLDEALPELLAAEEALKQLNKNDITEVKAMKHPPTGVVKVMETVCIIDDVKPIRKPGEKIGTKVNDYWPPAQALLSDPQKFLDKLAKFDKTRLTQVKIEQITPYVKDANFQPKKMLTISKACTSICQWVHALYKWFYIDLAVAPKKAAFIAASEELQKVLDNLAETKANMQAIQDRLKDLNDKLDAKIKYRQDQEAAIQLCLDRMDRAVRLINGLAGEKVRWIQTIKELEEAIYNITGDILLSSGAVAYITPFTDVYRRKLLNLWLEAITINKVPHTANCTPVKVLGEPVQIRLWQLDGLPKDNLSTENAVLISESKRWPLFIDPQSQANKWIRNMGKPLALYVVKLTDRTFIRTLESAIRFGRPILIENVYDELDPALDPILTRSVFRLAGQDVIKLGEVVIPWNDDFRLYITTKLPNPHYLPEVSIKVLLVNFTLVKSGLQDQLLAQVVAEERADLEEARNTLIMQNAQMAHELKEIQDRILYKLSSSEGSPVDDIDLIVTLEASKVKSDDIKSKVVIVETTQKDIDTTRELYVPVANRGSILFFCCADLALIDSMYQYSLEWFKTLFAASMNNTEPSDNIEERIETINNYFTFSLYTNVCRSLFERNKLHFAFLLCARILMDENKIHPLEWRYLLSPASVSKAPKPNPASKWLEERAWNEILALEELPRFKTFVEDFETLLPFFYEMFNSRTPHTMTYPTPWETDLDPFQKMCILKCIRPENVTNAMQIYIAENMGNRFIEPQTTDLSAMYGDSTPVTPLIFILSTGTDPAAELYKFAARMKMSKRLLSISLGQGQGPHAEEMLQDAQMSGNWVFFQNCHLAPSWMPYLERLIEELNVDQVHKDMRIWLTSTPSPNFPVAILQNGSKMTLEPPRGIKANLLKLYSGIVQEYYDFFYCDDPKVPSFKQLLFSICLFHGIILERRKFGALGFNIPYEFTDGDVQICISQLNMFLVEYDDVPFKVLTYTAGEINYGGRVTDDWDRRCLMNILDDFYNTSVLSPEYIFDKDKYYYQVPNFEKENYIEYIKTLPINDDPDLFGLHPNADITYARANTYQCLSTLLALQPREAVSAGESIEDVTQKLANSILKDLPKTMDHAHVMQKYPVMYEESLNTVLGQEVLRYNRLLAIIKDSLQNLIKAIKGLVVMSDALENLSRALFTNAIPDTWKARAYPSLQPLGAWIKDLGERVAFMKRWIEDGIPAAFWISGFFFPQAFLTGTLQNYARKNIISIDTIGYKFQVLSEIPTIRMEDGCGVYGLYLEGAKFDTKEGILAESKPKELYSEMPCMWFIPEVNHVVPPGVYECPVYKTLLRQGTLSTTGHSTNYVMVIEVPSKKSQKHWIKRGVALFCALDF